jgi:hypothetical protein
MKLDERPHSTHVLLLACLTRWGSTYDMLVRFLEPVVVKALEQVSEDHEDNEGADWPLRSSNLAADQAG